MKIVLSTSDFFPACGDMHSLCTTYQANRQAVVLRNNIVATFGKLYLFKHSTVANKLLERLIGSKGILKKNTQFMGFKSITLITESL